jgi:hypothetical protein
MLGALRQQGERQVGGWVRSAKKEAAIGTPTLHRVAPEGFFPWKPWLGLGSFARG